MPKATHECNCVCSPAKDPHAAAEFKAAVASIRAKYALYLQRIDREVDRSMANNGWLDCVLARAATTAAHEDLVQLGDNLTAPGVRSWRDLVVLAELARCHSSILEVPPYDRGQAMLRGLVEGTIALGNASMEGGPDAV